jgi:hypothetical protein
LKSWIWNWSKRKCEKYRDDHGLTKKHQPRKKTGFNNISPILPYGTPVDRVNESVYCLVRESVSGLTIDVRLPTGPEMLLLATKSKLSLWHAYVLSIRYGGGGYIPGEKRGPVVDESDHISPSIAGIKNMWNSASSLPYVMVWRFTESRDSLALVLDKMIT